MARISDASVKARTGRTFAEWFGVLDAGGAKAMDHPTTARWLSEQHGVSGWWAQNVTVEYERARGKRALGQRTSGAYEASVQRTLDASPARAEKALRAALAKLEGARASSTRAGRVLRYEAAGRKVEVTLTPKEGRAVVRVVESGLASEDAREKAKARWVKLIENVKESL